MLLSEMKENILELLRAVRIQFFGLPLALTIAVNVLIYLRIEKTRVNAEIGYLKEKMKMLEKSYNVSYDLVNYAPGTLISLPDDLVGFSVRFEGGGSGKIQLMKQRPSRTIATFNVGADDLFVPVPKGNSLMVQFTSTSKGTFYITSHVTLT